MTKSRLAISKRKKRQIMREVKELAFDNSEQAIKRIDEHLFELNPNDVDLLILKGNILDMIAKYDQALNVYRKILKINPDNPLVLIDLGDSYSYYRERYHKAIPYYDRALQLIKNGQCYLDEKDEFIDACEGKANALLELHKPMEALKCVIYGLQKYPANILLGSTLQRAQAQYSENYKKKLEERKEKRRSTRSK